MAVLKELLGERTIGRGLLSARFYLSPLAFFPCGYLRGKSFENDSHDIKDFKTKINNINYKN